MAGLDIIAEDSGRSKLLASWLGSSRGVGQKWPGTRHTLRRWPSLLNTFVSAAVTLLSVKNVKGHIQVVAITIELIHFLCFSDSVLNHCFTDCFIP